MDFAICLMLTIRSSLRPLLSINQVVIPVAMTWREKDDYENWIPYFDITWRKMICNTSLASNLNSSKSNCSSVTGWNSCDKMEVRTKTYSYHLKIQISFLY